MINLPAILSIAVLCLFSVARASGDDEHGDDEHGHSSIYTGGWRGHFGYAIPAAGEYHVSMMGRTCKNSYLNLVVLNAEGTMNAHLEETAQAYFNFTYPFNMQTAYSGCTYKSWGDAGTCPRVIIQQNSSMHESKTKYDAVGLPSDESKLATVPFFQLQFNTSASEACTNTAGVVADAHAGHNHRRSGDHEHGAGKMSMVIEFPTTDSAGNAITYPKNWYFFSDQNLTYWEFEVKQESTSTEVAQLSHEVLADPNTCSAAAAAATEVCNCQHDWLGGSDCDDEKYFWSGMIFLVGMIGLIPLVWKSCADSANMMIVLGFLNCFGGGALLAVAVAHVFPEAIDLYPATDSDDYPAAAMLCAAGYWALLLIDKVLVSFCMSSDTEKSTGDADPEVPMDSLPGGGAGHGLGVEKNEKKTDASADHDGCGMDKVFDSSNLLQAVGVFLAMSIHSLFAGFALGLKCNKDGVENLAIAIVCHKAFDVSALGIVLVKTNQELYKAIPLCLFVALMTPVGIWAGIAGDNVEHNTNGALQAICAGTFLYVAIQEVLSHEFAKRDSSMMILGKSIATGLGIGMIGLASIAHTRGGHSH